MVVLENPRENPCFGCGPANPAGLRLSPERIETEAGPRVRVTWTPPATHIGWPGLVHTGLHFTTLFETSYWAALELSGKVHVARGTQSFTQARLPRTDEPFEVEAWLVSRDPLRTRAESTSRGKPAGVLEVEWVAASAARVKAAGIDLPDYLFAEMDP